MYVVGDSGACLLVVNVCLTVDRVVGHGLPSRASVYRGCPCLDPPMCLGCPGWHEGKAPTLFLWLLECCLVNVSWWSKQGQRDCTFLLSSYLKCENTNRFGLCIAQNDFSIDVDICYMTPRPSWVVVCPKTIFCPPVSWKNLVVQLQVETWQ